MYKTLLFITAYCVSVAENAVPGTFFWKPRLGLYLAHPTEPSKEIIQPTYQNIKHELVILIDGYSIGLTMVALAAGFYAASKPFLHLSPISSYFYTNAYRWGLRHINLLPYWLGGLGGRYPDTHKVWRRRFYYMDEFVPKWMRKLVPWVKKKEWEQEEKDWKGFRKYAEPAFGKHYKYPNRRFDNFNSQKTEETIENLST